MSKVLLIVVAAFFGLVAAYFLVATVMSLVSLHNWTNVVVFGALTLIAAGPCAGSILVLRKRARA